MKMPCHLAMPETVTAYPPVFGFEPNVETIRAVDFSYFMDLANIIARQFRPGPCDSRLLGIRTTFVAFA